MNRLKNKTVLIGITGGIAAYKIADVISRLRKLGAKVEVVMTQNATEFITPLTIQTLSGSKVYLRQFDVLETMDVEHISLAKRADAMVICPATANTIAKLAQGIGDNLLTTVALAYTGPKMIVPAMNTTMWKHQITKKNIDTLVDIGYEVLQPESGLLACGDVGEGKMAEPQSIVSAIESLVTPKDLHGKTIVITAGPTMEPLDPVRYLTNHSSGKMGYAIAKEAKDRGANVVLIKGYTENVPPHVDTVHEINTTRELLEAVTHYFDNCDALIMPAAPLDYRPKTVSSIKIKKGEGANDELPMTFVRNPDVAKTIGAQKRNQITVGFAAETNEVLENAQKKLKKKNLDFIVANDLTAPGAGFREDTNIISILSSDGKATTYPKMDKGEVAKVIMDRIKLLLEQK